LTVTWAAPGIHGLVVTGTHGTGVSTPIAAEVAAATSGFEGVPHMPNVGMLTIGANAWMLAAGVSQVTGVPVGMTVSGTGAGGIAIEQVISAVLETSGGIPTTVRPPRSAINPAHPARAKESRA
jgi:hypothetical protein